MSVRLKTRTEGISKSRDQKMIENALNAIKQNDIYDIDSDRNNEERQIDEKSITSKNQYTFSSKGFYSYYTICYVLQKFILKQRHLTTFVKFTHEFEYDYKKYKEIITTGNIVFEWKNHLFNLYINGEDYANVLKSDTDITEIVQFLKHEIRYNNPLKGKLFQIRLSREGFYPIIKAIPNITFNDVILDEKLKEDIYDNTIFQLENLDENNGVILYGDPGVGKSLICSAIAHETTKKGYTVAYLSTQVDYTMLNEFIEEFVSPCILIFEDIDAFAESRENTPASGILSDFLQFVNGISEKEERIIFVATTNYLDRLDKAIANRPVRFNRKFKFDYPSDEQINKLVTLYFNDDISKKFAFRCYDKKFSGSHIKEIQRTANLLSKKRTDNIENVFEESVQLVQENFSPKLDAIGFK